MDKTLVVHAGLKLRHCSDIGLQLWDAIGGKNVFRSSDCYDLLREHSAEVRGVTMPNLSGDHVFNAIFIERKTHQHSAQAKIDDVQACLLHCLG